MPPIPLRTHSSTRALALVALLLTLAAGLIAVTAPTSQAAGQTCRYLSGFGPSPAVNWKSTFESNPNGVPFWVHRDLGSDPAQLNEILAAVATWEAAADVIDFSYQGLTTTSASAGVGDSQNVIGPAGPGRLGRNQLGRGIVGGSTIALHFDIELNLASDFPLGVATPGSNIADLQSLTLHEMGHVLALDHDNIAGQVMFNTLTIGTQIRSLGTNDANCLALIYGPAGDGAPTPVPAPTATPRPTTGPRPTPAPRPTATPQPAPTSTPLPRPTATPIAQATATPQPVPTVVTTVSGAARPIEVMYASTCLAGNGRVDVNIVNTRGAEADYRIEFPGLSPRQTRVEDGDWWRSPVTGRSDGRYNITVKRNGVRVSSSTVTVDCDDGQPSVSPNEVRAINACRDGNGYVLFQFANPSAARRSYIIEFEGVRNRSTSAPANGAAVRAVTGRGDGVYDVKIRVGSNEIAVFPLTVDCD